MRIDPPHAEPTTAFLFLNLTKNCSFFQLFQKCFQNKFLLVPLTAQPYNLCSKGATGLKLVRRIYSRHAEPTTKLLFKKSTKIVHIFNFFKKIKFKKLFARLCSNSVWGYLQSYFSVRSSVRMGPHAPMFFS